MLVRHSMQEKSWWKENYSTMNASLVKAFDQYVIPPEKVAEEICNWHPTRVYEYPWAIEFAPPRGRILDVGCNRQFGCALLGMGHTVCMHSLPDETETFNEVSPWTDREITASPCFRKYADKMSAIVGYFSDFPIRPGSFDVIYCISVIEHVDEALVSALVDGMWNALAPGGMLCITADWYPDFAVGDGIHPFVVNHHLGEFLSTHTDAKYVTPVQEIPWCSGFDQSLWNDPDVVIGRWNNQRLAVYGFVVKKQFVVRTQFGA